MNKQQGIQMMLITAVIVASLGAISLGVQGAIETRPTPDVIHSMAVPTQTPTVTPTAVPAAPEVALTVVPTRTMRYSNPLTPPDFVNIFQLVDPAHGYLATGGTTYDVTHSYASGSGAPGNPWETLMVGEVVSEGGYLWQIDYTATPAKGTLASQPIWGVNDPNELVMITCISKGPGVPATNNFIIRAERIN